MGDGQADDARHGVGVGLLCGGDDRLDVAGSGVQGDAGFLFLVDRVIPGVDGADRLVVAAGG